MSFRPKFSRKRGLDFRDDYRQPFAGRKAQIPTEEKFFSPTLICKRKPFIRLCCPHCHTRCLTFQTASGHGTLTLKLCGDAPGIFFCLQDYKSHLISEKHERAMVRRIQHIEERVKRLRAEQRLNQADKTDPASSSAVVKYCVICDLDFHEEESKHISSKLHVVLKELLERKCNICSYNAKDPVDYENHISSLEHQKREEGWSNTEESRQDLEQAVVLQPSSSQGASGNRENTGNSSPGNSLCEPENHINIGASANSGNKGGPSSVRSQSMGDIIKEVQALYCKCCNLFFSSDEDPKAASIKHCRTAEHKEMWLKYDGKKA